MAAATWRSASRVFRLVRTGHAVERAEQVSRGLSQKALAVRALRDADRRCPACRRAR
jgi:hypothetical protein